MNSFWSLFDWLLPAIRLTDDLRLDDPEALAGSTYALQSRTLSSSNRLQHQPRLQATSDAEGYRQRERTKNGQQGKLDRERESELVTSLRKENEGLRLHIQQLELDLELARRSLSYAQDISAPSLPLSVGLPQPPKAPLPTDIVALRTAYDALSASHTLVQQALRERNEEVTSLRTFLTKTDDMSGAQLVQAIHDLNSEILQLSASVADEFAGTFNRRGNYARQSDRDKLNPAIGVRTIEILEEQDHQADPTFVQFALQAWEVACVGEIMIPFCCGAPDQIQRVLSAVFQRIQECGEWLYQALINVELSFVATEPQATSSRWRALTHAHLRALLPAPHSNGSVPPPTPVSPSSAAPLIYPSTVILNACSEENLRGILAILVLAGCSDYNGLHRDPLRKRFGATLARISDRAYRLAIAFREGIMSAAFEVVIVPPSPGVTPGASQPKKGGLHVDIHNGTEFDDETMEDAFAGSGPQDEGGNVLCTVELGLACVRKVEGNDEANKPISTAPNGTRSPTSAALCSISPEQEVLGILRTSSASSSIEGLAKGPVLDRNLLVKPKVMLDSVTRILQL